MPGNEVGDRVHNFFGQENLSRVPYQQIADGNWTTLSNNLWSGNQRQISAPLVSNSKIFGVQQSGAGEHGHTSQSSHLSHGLNLTQLTQLNQRPESGRTQSLNQQLSLNGYMQGLQVFEPRKNEANASVDPESDRHNLMSRGLSLSELQGNGYELHKKNLARLDASMSPVNFNFFGLQQQTGTQHPGLMQGLPRQPTEINDMQLLHQHLMLTQMQELQRQQQLQPLDARQQNSVDQASSSAKAAVGDQPALLINGIPVNESSNIMWQPDVMTANSNWLQPSTIVQGSPGGVILSPEQGQPIRLMGLVPHQADQSLYGLPISSSSGASNHHAHIQVEKTAVPQISGQNHYPQVQVDKSSSPQVSGSTNSFPIHHIAAFADQGNKQERSSLSKQDIQGKDIFRHVEQGLNSGLGMENSQQVNYQFRTGYVQAFSGKQVLAGLSEPSQEKSVTEPTVSHGESTLDPTEEKILFGSDDNLWEVFVGNSGFSMLDNTDCLNGFPSMQSGSWSALMQSAVAETSSNGPSAQEEWSGLAFQNMEPPYSVGIDSGKQQPYPEKNLHVSSNSNCTQAIQHEEPKKLDSSTNHALHGFQQSGFSSHDHLDKLQIDTYRSMDSMPNFPDRGKWLDSSPQQKLLAEGNNLYGTSSVDNHAKSISSSHNYQQTPLSCNSTGQPTNCRNTWNLIESISLESNGSLRGLENENSSQPRLRIDHERPMHDGGHVFGMWRPDPTVRPSTSNLQVFEGDSSEKAQNSESRRLDSEGIRLLPNRHRVDLWRDVDSSRSSRKNKGPGKYQHQIGKSPLVLEPSENSNLDKGASEGREVEISNRKDSFTEGSLYIASHHAGGGLREPGKLNAGDSCRLFGSEPKSSGQVNRRSTGSHKFQYHPMGELEVDVEDSYGKKSVIDSQPLPQKLGDQGSRVQSHFGTTKRNYVESEKCEAEGFDEIGSKSMYAGHLPKNSSPFDRSLGNYAPMMATSSSQNMLELLHKVDQVRERGIATHISSQGVPYSKMTEPETSDGSVMHTQQNQCFGLQLGSPAQRSPIQEHAPSSQSSPQTVVNSITVNSKIGDNGHSWLNTIQHMTSQDPSQGILRNNVCRQISEKGFQYNVPENFPRALPSSFSFSRIHAQKQNVAGLSGQVATSQTFDASFVDRIPSNELDRSDEAVQINQPAGPCSPGSALVRTFARSVELSQSSITNHINSGDQHQQTQELDLVPARRLYNSPTVSQHGTSPKVYNVWTTVSTQHLSDFSLYPVKNVETVPGPEKSGSQDIEKEGNAPSRYDAHTSPSHSSVSKEHSEKEYSEQQAFAENADFTEKTMSTSHGKEPLVKCATDISHLTSATQNDTEALGRSLGPNNFLHQNHPQMHKTLMLRGTETDPRKHSIKRFKALDGGLESQQLPSAVGQHSPYGYNAMVKDTSVNGPSLTSANSKLLSFSPSPGDIQDGNASSQDKQGFDQKNANNFYSGNHIIPSGGMHSVISPQMAPSWFNQFGTFKNGKMSSVHDVQNTAPLKPVVQCHVGKQLDNLHVFDAEETVKPSSDANQPATCRPIPTPISVSSENIPSVLLSPEATDRNIVAIRPKKRKSFTSELIPWHKELTDSSERLQNISMAELDWATAANRLIEKVEDDAETIGELLPLVKPKRRLILTTLLMQQLLCLPYASFLSADVKLHYDSLVYSLARLTLGNACKAISSCSGNGNLTSSSNRDLWSEHKSSPKIGDEYFLKGVEDLMGRAKKVENDVSRADSRASVLDLRVECQDLERFSVINRFAKFHGRGQADGAETTSSTNTTGYVQKPFPQKYVNAVPIPKNLPDRVQCLLL